MAERWLGVADARAGIGRTGPETRMIAMQGQGGMKRFAAWGILDSSGGGTQSRIDDCHYFVEIVKWIS